ncbi:MAG: hypothetical protein ACFNUI_06315, partial [Negativicutes bacterium]
GGEFLDYEASQGTIIRVPVSRRQESSPRIFPGRKLFFSPTAKSADLSIGVFRSLSWYGI